MKTYTRSRGLGDSIRKVTKATGVERVVKTVTRAVGIEDCGCDKRQDTLNRVFPYSKK